MADLALVATMDQERSIERLVVGLRSVGLDVLVIDRGSSDDTMAAARHGGAVARSMPGASPAAALRSGWQMALRVREYCALVQIEAGGVHEPTDALGLLRGLVCADLVIGSRFLPGGRYAGARWQRWAARTATAACNARTGVRLSDWTSSYRAFNRRALAELAGAEYRSARAGWQIEVLGKALARGLRVVQAPVSCRAAEPALDWPAAREAAAAWTRI